MRKRLASCALTLGLGFWGGAAPLQGEIVYRQLDMETVAGSWTMNADDTLSIQRGAQFLDVNGDHSFEFELGHGYRRPLAHLPKNAADLASMAALGLEDISMRLDEIRRHSLGLVNSGVNDWDRFVAAQRSVDNQLDWINRVANNWSFEGQPLLNGSLGPDGWSSDVNALRVDRVTADTLPGDYIVSVKEVSERAHITADAQTKALDGDETLTINGVNIELFTGSTRAQVINRINEFTLLTGVVARDTGTATQVYSEVFGEAGSIDLISNRAMGVSSGFGTNVRSDVGVNGVWIVDGAEYIGMGRTMTVHDRDARGLTITQGINSSNEVEAFDGDVRVTVADNSPSFLLLPDGDLGGVTLTLPKVHSTALGVGVVNNQFSSLAEVNLANARKAQDALAIVDAAIDEIDNQRRVVSDFLRASHWPQGLAEFRSLESSGLVADDDGELTVMLEGELVGAGRSFSDQLLTHDSQIVADRVGVGDVSRFVGFRFEADGATHYGWMRVSFDVDNRLQLLDLAYDSEPGRSIRVGFVPEPSGLTFVYQLLVFGCLHVRRLVRMGLGKKSR